MECIIVASGCLGAGDDAAGLELAASLEARAPDECAFGSAGCALDLLDLFTRCETLLFLDSVSSGSPAGTLHIVPLPWREVAGRNAVQLTKHGWDVDSTVHLARALRRHLPRIVLVGIEVGSACTGPHLSAEVARTVAWCEAHFDRVRDLAEGGRRARLAPEELVDDCAASDELEFATT